MYDKTSDFRLRKTPTWRESSILIILSLVKYQLKDTHVPN